MIYQLHNPIDVVTPLGDCTAIMIIDYGVDVNTVWLCRMPGGEVKHFYSDDVRIYANPMAGKGYDVDIPENWRKPVSEFTFNMKELKEQLILRIDPLIKVDLIDLSNNDSVIRIGNFQVLNKHKSAFLEFSRLYHASIPEGEIRKDVGMLRIINEIITRSGIRKL